MNILQVKNLKTYFYLTDKIFRAVDNVSFDIEKGKVFGMVGESGSGKTLTALSILKLVSSQGKTIGGSVLFNGLDLLKIDEKALRGIRGSKIAIVFQEPASAFNPVFTIGEQLMESVITHQGLNGKKAREIVFEYLRKARITDAERIFRGYPHQLSGGTKQRAMIAMALVNSPELVILDEPTTALDVTIQAQILDLLDEIIDKENLSVLFISHDFGVVERMCDHIAIMRAGSIVEMGETGEVLRNPGNPYTVSLLESIKALA